MANTAEQLTQQLRNTNDFVYGAIQGNSALDKMVSDVLYVSPKITNRQNKFGYKVDSHIVATYPKITTSVDAAFKSFKSSLKDVEVNINCVKGRWQGSLKGENFLIVSEECSTEPLLWCALAVEYVLHLRDSKPE